MKKYNPEIIEKKWQNYWAEKRIYKSKADKTKKKFTEKKRKLSLYPKDKLPQYVQNHESKFKDWLD